MLFVNNGFKIKKNDNINLKLSELCNIKAVLTTMPC